MYLSCNFCVWIVVNFNEIAFDRLFTERGLWGPYLHTQILALSTPRAYRYNGGNMWACEMSSWWKNARGRGRLVSVLRPDRGQFRYHPLRRWKINPRLHKTFPVQLCLGETVRKKVGTKQGKCTKDVIL